MTTAEGSGRWKEALIDGALDWPKQKVDFEFDGSWRDIYILDTTLEDWRAVLAMVLHGGYNAALTCFLDDQTLRITEETQLTPNLLQSMFGAHEVMEDVYAEAGGPASRRAWCERLIQYAINDC